MEFKFFGINEKTIEEQKETIINNIKEKFFDTGRIDPSNYEKVQYCIRTRQRINMRTEHRMEKILEYVERGYQVVMGRGITLTPKIN